jgi:flagellar basal body-associated protein FliL
VSQTTTANAPTGSNGRVLAIILGILGVLAIILGVLYVAGALNSVHFMVGSHHTGSHQVRAAVSFVVGIVLLILAWAASRTRRG